MNDALAYWDRGVAAVPMMTGASTLMRGEDILEHAERLGLQLPLANVLDVGCGTGRVSAFCTGYLGVDIAPSAIGWCQAHGVPAIDRCEDCQRLSFPQQMGAAAAVVRFSDMIFLPRGRAASAAGRAAPR